MDSGTFPWSYSEVKECFSAIFSSGQHLNDWLSLFQDQKH